MLQHPNKDLVYNTFISLNILPLEIIDYIFKIIHLKGCLIMEDGKILNYYHDTYGNSANKAIHIVFPYNKTTISNYIGVSSQGQFPNTYSIEMGNKIEKINCNIFLVNNNLTEIELPDNITRISDKVFYKCINLRKIKLPKNLLIIGGFTFTKCSNLEEIVFPDKLQYIGMSAFEKCTNLTKIFIPKSVKELGLYAFNGCKKLDTLEFENNIGFFDYFDFEYLQNNNLNKYTVLQEGCFRLYNSNFKKLILKDKREDILDWIAYAFHEEVINWKEEIIIDEDSNIYIYEK